MGMTPISRVEANLEVALAQLGVAEDFGGWLAVTWGYLVYLKWDSWVWGIAVALAAYWAVTYRFRSIEKAASEAVFNEHRNSSVTASGI